VAQPGFERRLSSDEAWDRERLQPVLPVRGLQGGRLLGPRSSARSGADSQSWWVQRSRGPRCHSTVGLGRHPGWRGCVVLAGRQISKGDDPAHVATRRRWIVALLSFVGFALVLASLAGGGFRTPGGC